MMGGLEFTKNQKLALIAIVGLIAMGTSIRMVRDASSPVYSGVTIREPGTGNGVSVTASDSDTSHDPNSGQVTFQVAGAVNVPNVYTLPKGSRVIDAIKVAGGAKPGADTQSLNLAAKIEDEQRIYVQSAEQAAMSAAQGPDHVKINVVPSRSASSTSATAKLANPGDGRVHINTADSTELQRLPGVGPATAEKILEYRKQIGRFTSAGQLEDVKGIGPKKLENMRPFISL